MNPNPTYFIEGITGFLRSEREFHQKLAPYLIAYKKGVFVHDGISVPYFISRAKNERGVVVGVTGLNTIELFEEQKQNEISRLNEAGLSVIWIALPFPEKRKKINGDAIKIVREFLNSDHSPVQQLFTHDIPKILVGHSTANRIFYDLAHEENTNLALKKFIHNVGIAPTFGVGRTTRQYNRFERLALLAFAKKYPDLTIQETTPGQIFLALKASGEEYSETLTNPLMKGISTLSRKIRGFKPPLEDKDECKYKGIDLTFGQLAELHERSERLMDSFNPAAANFTTTTIVASPHDNFICFKTIEKIAGKMEAKLISVPNAGHYPTKKNPVVFNEIIDRLLSSVSAFETAAAAKEKPIFISLEDYTTFHQKPTQYEPAQVVSMTDWLSRLGAPLKGPTSALNAFTRVLQ